MEKTVINRLLDFSGVLYNFEINRTVDGQIKLGQKDNHISQNLQICIV
jgi:hypothetical protein